MKIVGVVLAAGLGTRLRPSTDYKPKPLIPVAGVEPLFFALDNFRRAGVKRVVVNAHHLPAQVTQAIDEWSALFPELELRCVVENPEILGTGGGLVNLIRSCSDWTEGAALLIQNGDTLAHVDLARMLGRASSCRFAVSYLGEHLRKYSPLWVGADGRWSGIGKKAPHPGDRAGHFLGVHYLSARAVDEIARGDFAAAPSDLFNAIYRPLTDAGHAIEAVEYFGETSDNDFWFDMTTQEFLLEAQRHVFHAPCWRGSWRDLLVRRHPGIRDAGGGVMCAGPVPGDMQDRVTGPMVYVNRSELQPDSRSFDFRRLGPDVTILIERLAEEKVFLLPERSANAVIVVAATAGQTFEDSLAVDNAVMVV